jgi:predicted transcriptional regulator
MRPELTERTIRLTMYYMKTATLTIRLDKELDELLSKACRRTGRSRSEIARDALSRQVRLVTFEELRRRIMPFAEARGYLTDEDIFAKIP